MSKAYLLTWNPEKYNDGGSGASDYMLDFTLATNRRWTCHSKQIKSGDVVYLIRLGSDPKGIVAKGTATSESYEAPYWGDTSKNWRYVDIDIEESRPNCTDGLLPMVLLHMAIPSQAWSPQSSGIEIKQENTSTLNQLWEQGYKQHSLKQFVQWTGSQPKYSGEKWLSHYRKTVAIIRDVASKNIALDTATLSSIWTEQNGVADAKQGALSNAEMANNESDLINFTYDILKSPTTDMLNSIYSKWQNKIDNGFSKMNRSVIHRVFAAAAPELYTSIVNKNKCESLLAVLKKQFQFNCSAEKNANWADINTLIKKCMIDANLLAERTLENNVAMWRLYDESCEKKEIDNTFGVSESVAPKYNHKESFVDNIPLNQILYGPPGTGKTYHTIDEALRILEPNIFEDIKNIAEIDAREKLVERFNFYKAQGRVIFCTFHQSFSYEDFVEGLRAEIVGESINYTVGRGVFKKLCDDIITPTGDLKIDDAVDRFIEDIAENPVELETATGKKFGVKYKSGNTTLTCTPLSSKTGLELPANIRHIRNVIEGNMPEKLYCESYVKGIARYIKQSYLKISELHSIEPDKNPRVLIIDEINRGNISKIFGELITLIEPSKRAGEVEALEVILPYSKKPFSIPSNVYIIGTMNTSDRSLSGLDIALRRRFVFKEMPPKTTLLDGVDVVGINIGALLRVINQRIEVLLGRDYCLGHAYFMSLNNQSTIDDLAVIFQKQIFPLLQEYFFEDWQRIQWVLNDHRKKANHFLTQKTSNELNNLFGADVSITEHQLPWIIHDDAFKQPEAYRQIIQVSE